MGIFFSKEATADAKEKQAKFTSPTPPVSSVRSEQVTEEKFWHPEIAIPQSTINSSVFQRQSMHTPIIYAYQRQQLEVEYRRAEENSEVAKYLLPVSRARGEEQITEEKPWHPGQGRSFGFYRCSSCGAQWTSAYSWADETQSCKDCGNRVLPHKQKPLNQNPDPEKLKKPHMQELCGKCQKLGRLCTLSMEPSKSREHPDDVVVKGLPLDITEEQLIIIFRPYGAILRAYIPPPRPGFSNRIAFITFQNPKAALQKFNLADVPVFERNRYRS